MSEEENTFPENANSGELKGDESNLQGRHVEAGKKCEPFANQSSIENMEVHHHPDLHRKRKNFKEYILEFLMIFLAVTLGFFAENIREHFVNSEKEKNYMEGMLQDLEKDTADISNDIGFKNLIVKKMDSALNIPIVNLRSIPTQDTFFHHFFFYYSWPSSFNRHDITITQLKNTGGFSVIRKQTVLKAINELNSFYESPLQFNQNIYNEHWNKLDQFAMQLIRLPSPPEYG